MRRKYVSTLLAAAGIFLIVHVIDALFARVGLHAEVTYLNDVLIALAVGALVFFLEHQHEHRLSEQRHQTVVIARMNHHIRNALQVIVCRSNVKGPNSQEIQDIRTALDRIDWALREILPSMWTGAADNRTKQNACEVESGSTAASQQAERHKSVRSAHL